MALAGKLKFRELQCCSLLSAACVISVLSVVPTGNAIAQTAGPSSNIEEVIVSAERRQARSVDVPISVASMTADSLQAAGVGSTAQLAQAVPGLRMDLSGAYVQPTIRGVGSALAGPGSNSNVAIYVDGFYVPNLLGSDFSLASVSSVEVLKGPQGTLFGRNATGGAILVTTRDPSQTPGAEVKVSYGSYNHLTTSFYGTTGLTPTVAADLLVFRDQGDGYVKNVVTNNDKQGKFTKNTVRSKISLTPNDFSTYVLTLEHREVDDPTPNLTNNYQGLTTGVLLPVVPGGAVNTVNASRPWKYAGTSGVASTFRGDSVTLRADFDFDWARLTSYTMYRDERGFERKDYDGTPGGGQNASWHAKDKTISQEFNLSADNDENLSWLLGMFFYQNKNDYPAFNLSVPAYGIDIPHFFDSHIKQQSYAVFGDMTYEFAERWFLTAGLRLGIDKTEASYNNQASLMGGVDVHRSGNALFRNATPRIILRHQLTDESNVYASFSQGYKAGLIPILESTDRVDPEKINAFEVGYKLATARLRFDASAFYYDYKDLQVASYGANGVSSTRNAAKSKIKGLDAQLSAKLSDRISVNMGATYTRAEYDSFPGAPSIDTTDFSSIAVDASGNAMMRSPRFTGNIGISYDQPLAGGDLTLQSTYYRTTKIYFDPANQFSQDAYGLLNASATWVDANDKLSLSLYGSNLSNTKYIAQVLPDNNAAAQTFGEPRTFGVSVGYKF